jgi:Holliday junction resolvase
MGTNVAEVEVEALNELRKNFEAEGYSFILNPTTETLPDFLHDNRPDAIAIGPNEKVVVEVKSRRTRASAILLELMAQKVSSQPGWRLLIVYTGESSEVLELHRADQHQIDRALHDIRSLMKVGPNRVLLVAVWSVFEVLARNLYPEGDPGATKPLSPMHVVERLAR